MFGEFYIAKDLEHPHIIEYKYFMKSYCEKTKFHEFHILMEYLDGGDMEDFLKEAAGPPTKIEWVQAIASQILSALVYLHEDRKIIHQDLKPCNILFTSKKRDGVKLIDLGVSSQIEFTKSSKESGRGTLRYMPPEQLDGKLSFKNDIWAFGCVLLQLVTGARPFFKIDNDIVVCMEVSQGKSPLDHYV